MIASRRIVAVFLTVAFLAATASFTLTYRLGLSALDADLDQSLILTRRSIESEIERFRYLPDVTAEDARIGSVLSAPASATTDAANHYLETVTGKSGATDLFLLDHTGTAIASSNWNTGQSFVGNNYAFRPYFRDAISTGKGRFYAIGVTTGKPGYFLSSRIEAGGRTGVLVVKIDLKPLEATWKSARSSTAIADRDGIVFLSGIDEWLYRPFTTLAPEPLAKLSEVRTYDGIDLAVALPLLDKPERLSLPGPDNVALRGRLTRIEADGWSVLSAAPTAPVFVTAALWAMGAALVAMAGTGLGLILHQRRQLIQLRLRQGALLETRVAERTRELAREVEARRKTEDDLRAAQETLVHSEKMAALGRMSAAIVHEMSQPLAAMEATLAAAEMSQEEGKTAARIGTARNLIRRMQRTTKHLKSFSRKEPNQLTLTDLNRVAENALDLVEPRAKSVGVTPAFHPATPAPLVMAGPVRLEQVFLNLLLNALDAVDGRRNGAVTVETTIDGPSVSFSVSDNGSGIAPGDIARVTEPFFSTKIGSEGLGLGLSISQAIVTEFGGRLDIVSPPGEGTRTSVVLPAAATTREAAE